MKLLTTLLASVAVSMAAHATVKEPIENRVSKQTSAIIEADLTTGTNRLYGKPLYDFGEPFGTTGFSSIYGYDPAGESPLDLTAQTPGDTLIATGVDPIFLSFFGLNESDVNTAWINLPIRDVPSITDRSGDIRETTPGMEDATS